MSKKFDFWAWMVRKDAPLIWLISFCSDARSLWGLKYLKWIHIGRRLIRRLKTQKGKMFIVLNAPSVKEQRLECLRNRGLDFMFVNQGFRLPQYKELHPKFHIFIDTKLIHGIWDVKWFDEILEMVPDITFVLPAAWAGLSIFKPYIKRNIPIIWWRDWDYSYGHGVSKTAFDLARLLGYETIYFTGYEGTAFASSLVKQSSHFYGNDSDEEGKPVEVIMKEYYMNANHFNGAIRTARKFHKQGVRLINLSKGGIMDMYERKSFEEEFPE